MLTPNQVPANPRMTVRISQIIVGAMILGLAGFAGAIAFLRMGNPPEEPYDPTLLVSIASGLTLVSTLFVAFVPQPGVAEPSRAGVTQFLAAFVSRKVTSAALVEGPGLFWIVIAFISGNLAYLVGGAFAIVLLFREFPTEAQLENAADLEFAEMERILEAEVPG